MRKICYITLSVSVVAISSIIALTSNKSNQPNLLFLSNVEALTEVTEIEKKWYIIDNIPCYSGGEEARWDCSYTRCYTCEPEKGKGEGQDGTCTNIRPFGI